MHFIIKLHSVFSLFSCDTILCFRPLLLPAGASGRHGERGHLPHLELGLLGQELTRGRHLAPPPQQQQQQIVLQQQQCLQVLRRPLIVEDLVTQRRTPPPSSSGQKSKMWSPRIVAEWDTIPAAQAVGSIFFMIVKYHLSAACPARAPELCWNS